jgi:hypothetical protein
MDEGVGARLSEARGRRGLGLDRVAADTKIRVRYLRAMEADDWDALPGETYARAFLRTYAGYLGLDAEALAEEQRRGRGVARPGERLPQVDAGAPTRAPREPRRRISPRLLAAIVSVGLVVVLVAIGILSGGGSGSGHSAAQGQGGRHPAGVAGRHATSPPQPAGGHRGHTLRLVADAEVWVCLLGSGGSTLVDGRILSPGASEGPFRSGSFTFSLGNGEVTMTVDGKQAHIPPTSSPIGYSVTGGGLSRLPEGERPTCT